MAYDMVRNGSGRDLKGLTVQNAESYYKSLIIKVTS